MKLRELLAPLKEAATLSYEEEKEISENLDLRLGFNYSHESVSSSVLGAEIQTWSHLSPQAFQTPYPELLRIIQEVDPLGNAKNWIDLGAAYGRLGLLLAVFRPDADFLGIEAVPLRVREAQRVYEAHGIPTTSLREGDCAREPFPRANIYFIYDFGHEVDVRKALEELRDHARTQPIKVVGRGRRIRDLIEKHHPWLGLVHDPIHRPHYSIYRSDSEERSDEE